MVGVRPASEPHMDADGETFGEPDVTCPVCGYIHECSFELDNCDDQYECPNCGAILSYERETTVVYNTKVVSLPKIANM